MVHSGGKSNGLTRRKMCMLKLRETVLRLKCTCIKYLNTIFINASAWDFLEIGYTCLIRLLVYIDCQIIQAYTCYRPVHRWTIILFVTVLSDTDLVRLVRMETSQKCIYYFRMCVCLSACSNSKAFDKQMFKKFYDLESPMFFKITRHTGHIAWSTSGDSAGIMTGSSTWLVKCLAARKTYPQHFMYIFCFFIGKINVKTQPHTEDKQFLLTAWCKVLLEQLPDLQLVKKFPAFHGTRRFITALTSVRHLSVSWASPIQSIYQHPTSWRSILILSTHLRLGLPSGLFPSGFPTKTLYTPLSSPISATCPAHLILLDFITRKILGEQYKSFSSSLCNLIHSSVTSFLLGPNILLNITEYNTFLNFVTIKQDGLCQKKNPS